MNLNPDKKIYITIAAFIVAILLLFLLFILPAFNKIKKSSQELFLQKVNLSNLEKEALELKEPTNLKDRISDNFQRINKLFIDPEIPVDFINFLEKEASSSQLEIEVSPIASPKKETDPWRNISFQITTEGSFPNFLKFLEKIENSPYLIELVNLNIKKGTRETGVKGTDITAVFVIKAFTL